MPNWNQLLDEIRAAGSMHDVMRRRYLAEVPKLLAATSLSITRDGFRKGTSAASK